VTLATAAWTKVLRRRGGVLARKSAGRKMDGGGNRHVLNAWRRRNEGGGGGGLMHWGQMVSGREGERENGADAWVDLGKNENKINFEIKNLN
jgi:hypothetical protein